MGDRKENDGVPEDEPVKSTPQSYDFSQDQLLFYFCREFGMERLRRVCSKLDEWKTNCLMTIVLLSFVGILSDAAILAGIIWEYSSVFVGLTIGIFTSASLIATRVAKSHHRKRIIDEFKTIVNKDQSASETLVASKNVLLELAETVQSYDNSSQLKNIFCAVLLVLRTLCALLFIFTYFPIDEFLLSTAVIGLIFDGFNLVMSGMKLGTLWKKDNNCSSEFGKDITSVIELFKQHRVTVFAKINKPEQNEGNASNERTTLLSINDKFEEEKQMEAIRMIMENLSEETRKKLRDILSPNGLSDNNHVNESTPNGKNVEGTVPVIKKAASNANLQIQSKC